MSLSVTASSFNCEISSFVTVANREAILPVTHESSTSVGVE